MEIKIVFYRTLLSRGKNITANERIFYSFLAAKSVGMIEDAYDKEQDDGIVTLNMDEVYMHLQQNDNWIDCYKINKTKLADALGFTRISIITYCKHLCEKGYLREDGDSYKIYVNKELLMRGYFELKHTDIISGELLIFYSYLRDKGSQHDYIIDTYKSKMHEEIGNSEVSITKLLNRLYEVGLAERVKGNNKLIIR